MTIFFVIITIVLIIARVLMGYFSDVVEFFAPLLTPLTIASVVTGIIAFIFVAIKIWGAIMKIVSKKKDMD